MARYKPYDLRQDKLIQVRYADQIVPGWFEYTLDRIVEEHLDLSVFDRFYSNDETGRAAYDPKVLLKVVLYAYSKGIVTSRQIEHACCKNVVFMALSADTRPHFTTIAGFVTDLEKVIVELFANVLLYCDELGLIGKEHFAVDGCKMPSNASKRWSGTHEEFGERRKKMKKAADEIVRRHREQDNAEKNAPQAVQEERKLKRLRKGMEKIDKFLATHEKNMGPSGKERKGNITDPDSAKMTTSHGVMQGFNGMAVVDDKHQIVVEAQAFGDGQEAHLLKPLVEQTRKTFERLGEPDVFEETKLTADNGCHSAESVKYLQENGVDAYIPDRDYRKRDPGFAGRDRYKERHRKERERERRKKHGENLKLFGPEDFIYDEKAQTCICPAGQRLYRSGTTAGLYKGVKFKGPYSACEPCPLRSQCLRHPDRTRHRQVMFFKGRRKDKAERPIDIMKRKIATVLGRLIYAKRLGTVEPVFGNARNKGMDRFTLRGRPKVDAQWKLFMMVLNIEKVANYAPG